MNMGKGESVIYLEVIDTPSIFNVIRSCTVLTRMLPTLDLICEENTALW